MRIPWIYACVLVFQTVSNCAFELDWWEARRSCIEEGTDLLTPYDKIPLEETEARTSRSYWVGGSETSQWRWTDNTPLFTHMGQYNTSNAEDVEVKDIPGNSALECYRECGTKRFGLSGSNCYCLGDVESGELYEKTGNIGNCTGNQEGECGTSNIGNCPGNHEEECGTNSSMSVYEIDIDFDVGSNERYQCGYAWKTLSGNIKVGQLDCNATLKAVCGDGGKTDPSCEEENSRPFHRCVNDLCVTCDSEIWSSANRTCTLAKVSHSRESDLYQLLNSTGVASLSRYWVGLHKIIQQKWINGEEVIYNYPIRTNQSYTGPRCLGLLSHSKGWTGYWLPCNTNLHSLCNTRENQSKITFVIVVTFIIMGYAGFVLLAICKSMKKKESNTEPEAVYRVSDGHVAG